MDGKKLINLGVQAEQPGYLQSKIRLSNGISLGAALLVALPLLMTTLINFPELIMIPLAGLLATLGVLLLNRMHVQELARGVASLVPVLMTSVFHACVSGQGQELIPGLLLIQAGFALLPLVLFDYRERVPFFLLTGCNGLLVTQAGWLNEVISRNLGAGLFRETLLGRGSMVLGVIVIFGSLLALIREYRKSDQQMNHFRHEAEVEKQKLKTAREEMSRNMDQLKEARAEEQKRQWAVEGLDKINEILRKECEDNQQIYDELISFLVNYLKANQGGLFMVEEDEHENQSIELGACYAYSKKKYASKTILPGEGLIGQAFLEREYIYLEKVPENYITITSGLGDAPPRSLLVMPMMNNNRVEGLLEFASFQLLEPHQIEFLQQAGETIGASVRNIRVSEKMRMLLAEAQENTEELRAQEEEIRQNNEELTATQEQLTRSLEDVQMRSAKSEAILKETTDGIITINARGVIDYINPTAVHIFGYPREEVIGQKVNLLMPSGHARNHDGYLDHYHRTGEKQIIGKGRRVEGKRKDGSSVTLNLRVNEFWVGEERFYAGALRDVTEEEARIKDYEEQLADKNLENLRLKDTIQRLKRELAH